MAKQKSARNPGSASAIATTPRRQHSLVWVQGLLCGALVTLATPTALLLGVLLGPALLAIVFDRDPGRPRARSIALCGMAAAVGPLRILWTTDHSLAHATALLSNLHVVGTAWIAAAAGWLLAEIVPVTIRAALDGLSVARAARLRAERAKLVEAWGLGALSDDQ
jgi:hypothetical protein